MPPNCTFEIDDAEDEWLFRHKFDYIHARLVFSCFKDPRNVMQSAFDSLAPGGYLELQDVVMPMAYAEPPAPDSPFVKLHTLMMDVSAEAGRPWTNTQHYAQWAREMGFEDVVEKRFTLHVGLWGESAQEKKLGAWHLENILDAMQGVSARIVSRIEWEKAEVDALLDQVRGELRNGKIKLSNDIRVVWGRKPLPVGKDE